MAGLTVTLKFAADLADEAAVHQALEKMGQGVGEYLQRNDSAGRVRLEDVRVIEAEAGPKPGPVMDNVEIVDFEVDW